MVWGGVFFRVKENYVGFREQPLKHQNLLSRNHTRHTISGDNDLYSQTVVRPPRTSHYERGSGNLHSGGYPAEIDTTGMPDSRAVGLIPTS